MYSTEDRNSFIIPSSKRLETRLTYWRRRSWHLHDSSWRVLKVQK